MKSAKSNLMLINHEGLANKNVMFEVTKVLDAALALGQLTQRDALAVWSEWVVVENFDETIGNEAEAWMNGRLE